MRVQISWLNKCQLRPKSYFGKIKFIRVPNWEKVFVDSHLKKKEIEEKI